LFYQSRKPRIFQSHTPYFDFFKFKIFRSQFYLLVGEHGEEAQGGQEEGHLQTSVEFIVTPIEAPMRPPMIPIL
jgi:hypothetical protein